MTSDPKLPVENDPSRANSAGTSADRKQNMASSTRRLVCASDPQRQSNSGCTAPPSSSSCLISAVAGVLLVILPWTPEWTDNYLLLSFPWLRTLVTTGFFRGLCSGLGLLDIWIGFWEALHYHEHQ